MNFFPKEILENIFIFLSLKYNLSVIKKICIKYNCIVKNEGYCKKLYYEHYHKRILKQFQDFDKHYYQNILTLEPLSYIEITKMEIIKEQLKKDMHVVRYLHLYNNVLSSNYYLFVRIMLSLKIYYRRIIYDVCCTELEWFMECIIRLMYKNRKVITYDKITRQYVYEMFHSLINPEIVYDKKMYKRLKKYLFQDLIQEKICPFYAYILDTFKGTKVCMFS